MSEHLCVCVCVCVCARVHVRPLPRAQGHKLLAAQFGLRLIGLPVASQF